MPVHMLGFCKVNEIIKIAKNRIVVIDDNCEALEQDGKINLWSQSCMYGVLITENNYYWRRGMITTNNYNLYKLSLEYRDHGHENNQIFPGRDTQEYMDLTLEQQS